MINEKLRFEDRVQSIVSKVEQRMYIVRNFVHLSTFPFASMLFKSLVVSLLTYCLPVLGKNTNLVAKDKKCLKILLQRQRPLGLRLEI